MKTPQQSYPNLAVALGVRDVFLKREDLHKYGSHKGRSIPLMIKTYAKEGIRDFVISSSGNAALAAIMTTAQHNKNNPDKQIQLTVYVGKNIPDNKLATLTSHIVTLSHCHIVIEQSDRPKQQAFQKEKKSPGTTKFLRQSTDDLALEGYVSLAEELNKIPNLQAIFIPTSSGTTAQALGQAFAELGQHPQFHIIQTTACHPIAAAFEKENERESPHSVGGDDASRKRLPAGRQVPEKTSIAGAIVDNIAYRKDKLINLIKESNGSGWIVSDQDINNAVELVKTTTGIDVSPNSALSVAGLKKAVAHGFIFDGPVACLITGR